MDAFIQCQPAGAANVDPVLIPSVRPDLLIQMGDHERVAFHGRANVTMLRYDAEAPGDDVRFLWSLVETAEVLITNERLIYRANTISRSSGALAGFRESLGAKLTGSRHLPIRPDAYVGHIRFSWIADVTHAQVRKLGTTIGIVMITALGPGDIVGSLHLTFGVDDGASPWHVAGPLAIALTSAVARHRLAGGTHALPDAGTQRLAGQRDTPRGVPAGPDILRFELPGAVAPASARQAAPTLPPLPVLLAALSRAIDAL